MQKYKKNNHKHSIKLNDIVYSNLFNEFLIVECVRFVDSGIIWLKKHDKTIPHTLKDIKCFNNCECLAVAFQ